MKLIQTFSFGYLPSKWKRLIRALSLALWIICLFCLDPFYGGGILDMLFDSVVPMAWIPLILIPIISWILKPFAVKDEK